MESEKVSRWESGTNARRHRPAFSLSHFLTFAAALLLTGCASLPSPPTSGAVDPENPIAPLFRNGTKAVVLIFVRPDCPVANRYAPEIQRLSSTFAALEIEFRLVYPDPDLSPRDIERHQLAYRLRLESLHDPHHVLVRKTGVRVTPEAAVFLAGGRQVYRGRIDDRYADFGKERPAPSQRDLEEVLGSIVGERPVTNAFTRAIGCAIVGLP